MPDELTADANTERVDEGIETSVLHTTPAIATDANTCAIEAYMKKLQIHCPSGRCGESDCPMSDDAN